MAWLAYSVSSTKVYREFGVPWAENTRESEFKNKANSLFWTSLIA